MTRSYDELRRDLETCTEVSLAREKALGVALRRIDDALDALAAANWIDPTQGDLRRIGDALTGRSAQ